MKMDYVIVRPELKGYFYLYARLEHRHNEILAIAEHSLRLLKILSR